MAPSSMLYRYNGKFTGTSLISHAGERTRELWCCLDKCCLGKLMVLRIGVEILVSQGCMRDDDDDDDYLRLGGYNALKPSKGYEIVLS